MGLHQNDNVEDKERGDAGVFLVYFIRIFSPVRPQSRLGELNPEVPDMIKSNNPH